MPLTIWNMNKEVPTEPILITFFMYLNYILDIDQNQTIPIENVIFISYWKSNSLIIFGLKYAVKKDKKS